MTQRFAAGARRLAGLAGRLLGWPPPWFWSATPAELAAILADEAAERPAAMDRATLEKLLEGDHDER